MTPPEHLRIAALASDPAVHDAFSWLHLHEPQLRRWQLEFLAIPAPSFGEADRARWFLDRFRDLGLGNPHIDAEGNALAELGSADSPGRIPAVPSQELEPAAGEGSPVILLSAHLDTVFPAGTDCRPRQEDEHGGRIFGPGACDNGAGLAALLGIAAALKHAAIRPACTILFSANVGEEGEGDLRGMRHLFSASPFSGRIRAAIALEGSGTASVVDRALGSRRLRVTVCGTGGHSWADAGRPNPILALCSALLATSNLPLPSNPRTTLSCGTIRGGTSVNSIPESATADLDLRSTSAIELDRMELAVLSTLTATVEASGHENPSTSSTDAADSLLPPKLPLRRDAEPDMPPRELQRPQLQLQLHVERIGDRRAGSLDPTSPLATSLRAVDRHLGLATESRIGSTDANLPLSLGIPALAIGTGGTSAGIHTVAEWYDPTGRELALRRILLLLLDTCTLFGR